MSRAAEAIEAARRAYVAARGTPLESEAKCMLEAQIEQAKRAQVRTR